MRSPYPLVHCHLQHFVTRLSYLFKVSIEPCHGTSRAHHRMRTNRWHHSRHWIRSGCRGCGGYETTQHMVQTIQKTNTLSTYTDCIVSWGKHWIRHWCVPFDVFALHMLILTTIITLKMHRRTTTHVFKWVAKRGYTRFSYRFRQVFPFFCWNISQITFNVSKLFSDWRSFCTCLIRFLSGKRLSDSSWNMDTR